MGLGGQSGQTQPLAPPLPSRAQGWATSLSSPETMGLIIPTSQGLGEDEAGRHMSSQHSRFEGDKPKPEAGVRADNSSQRALATQRFTAMQGTVSAQTWLLHRVKLGTSSVSVCSRAPDL